MSSDNAFRAAGRSSVMKATWLSTSARIIGFSKPVYVFREMRRHLRVDRYRRTSRGSARAPKPMRCAARRARAWRAWWMSCLLKDTARGLSVDDPLRECECRVAAAVRAARFVPPNRSVMRRGGGRFVRWSRSCVWPSLRPPATASVCVPAPHGNSPTDGFRERHLRLFLGDAQVAGECAFEAAAHGIAVDRGNDDRAGLLPGLRRRRRMPAPCTRARTLSPSAKVLRSAPALKNFSPAPVKTAA